MHQVHCYYVGLSGFETNYVLIAMYSAQYQQISKDTHYAVPSCSFMESCDHISEEMSSSYTLLSKVLRSVS
jgi:hypothetical protein